MSLRCPRRFQCPPDPFGSQGDTSIPVFTPLRGLLAALQPIASQGPSAEYPLRPFWDNQNRLSVHHAIFPLRTDHHYRRPGFQVILGSLDNALDSGGCSYHYFYLALGRVDRDCIPVDLFHRPVEAAPSAEPGASARPGWRVGKWLAGLACI